MARPARVAVPEHPQHLTQQGKRRQQTFFTAAAYRPYKQLPAAWCEKEGRKSKKKESQ
jgi:REP element-mobilizing transposase RayT